MGLSLAFLRTTDSTCSTATRASRRKQSVSWIVTPNRPWSLRSISGHASVAGSTSTSTTIRESYAAAATTPSWTPLPPVRILSSLFSGWSCSSQLSRGGQRRFDRLDRLDLCLALVLPFLPVRRGHPVRKGENEALVVLDLLGCRLVLEDRDRVVHAFQPGGLELIR